jgi:hypothetical protein
MLVDAGRLAAAPRQRNRAPADPKGRTQAESGPGFDVSQPAAEKPGWPDRR